MSLRRWGTGFGRSTTAEMPLFAKKKLPIRSDMRQGSFWLFNEFALTVTCSYRFDEEL